MSGDVHEPKAWSKDEFDAHWRAALERELLGAKARGDDETVKAVEAQLGRKSSKG